MDSKFGAPKLSKFCPDYPKIELTSWKTLLLSEFGRVWRVRAGLGGLKKTRRRVCEFRRVENLNFGGSRVRENPHPRAGAGPPSYP